MKFLIDKFSWLDTLNWKELCKLEVKIINEYMKTSDNKDYYLLKEIHRRKNLKTIK